MPERGEYDTLEKDNENWKSGVQTEMKRVILPIILLVLMIVIIRVSSGGDSMTIRPEEFSQETQEILEIFQDEAMLFDYTVDRTVESKIIGIWVCEDGNWQTAGSSAGRAGTPKEKIAVKISEDSCAVFDIDGSGNAEVICDLPGGFQAAGSWTEYRLSEPADIELGRDIVLWARFDGAEGDQISDFRTVSCDSGVAVTVQFMGEKV